MVSCNHMHCATVTYTFYTVHGHALYERHHYTCLFSHTHCIVNTLCIIFQYVQIYRSKLQATVGHNITRIGPPVPVEFVADFITLVIPEFMDQWMLTCPALLCVSSCCSSTSVKLCLRLSYAFLRSPELMWIIPVVFEVIFPTSRYAYPVLRQILAVFFVRKFF